MSAFARSLVQRRPSQSTRPGRFVLPDSKNPSPLGSLYLIALAVHNLTPANAFAATRQYLHSSHAFKVWQQSLEYYTSSRLPSSRRSSTHPIHSARSSSLLLIAGPSYQQLPTAPVPPGCCACLCVATLPHFSCLLAVVASCSHRAAHNSSPCAMPPRAPLQTSFSVADVNNEVICPLRNQDGSNCRKRCLGVSLAVSLLCRFHCVFSALHTAVVSMTLLS